VYTHWQASWRGGGGLGLIAVVAVVFFVEPFAPGTALQRALLMMAVVGGMALYTLVVVASIRLGLRLSGRARVGRGVVLGVPALYLVALASIAFVRLRTHAQPLEVVTARDALIHNVMLPGLVFLLMFVALPAFIAFALARFTDAAIRPAGE
jgi:hypothetical protein